MDEKKLMMKNKSELLRMLKEKGLKSDSKAKKQDIVRLLLKAERSSKQRAAAKSKTKKRTKKVEAREPKKDRKPKAAAKGTTRPKTDKPKRPAKATARKPTKKVKILKRKGKARPTVEITKAKVGIPTKEPDLEIESLRTQQQRVEETKYSTEMTPPETTAEDSFPQEAPEQEKGIEVAYPAELPKGYGDDRIVAMVRDPYWIFAYWEVTPESLQRARQGLGEEGDRSKVVLRIYDITDIDFTGENANSQFDIEVIGNADNWYINTGRPNRSYCVDIGLLSPEGDYQTLARSNPVRTPRASMSEEVDERWMSLEEEFERMYALSGGFQIGHGSIELKEMMEKQLQMQLASEAVGSLFSMAVPQKERGFRLVVNTELIVYGATQPGATVTIQEKPVVLRPDGTFSVRFALPDGVHDIPVTAESPDGIEQRSITPTVTRTTSTQAPVLKK